MIRFRIAEELRAGAGGYRRVRADYAAFAADLDLRRRRRRRSTATALLAALRPYFRARGIEANWDAVEQTGDAMLVTTLCMVCPFDVRGEAGAAGGPTRPTRARRCWSR